MRSQKWNSISVLVIAGACLLSACGGGEYEPESIEANGQSNGKGDYIWENTAPRWIGDFCGTKITDGRWETDDKLCGYPGGYCHPGGMFCTRNCDGQCPNVYGHAETFCIDDPLYPGRGICVQTADDRNGNCRDIGLVSENVEIHYGRPTTCIRRGTYLMFGVPRYGDSTITNNVCYPELGIPVFCPSILF